MHTLRLPRVNLIPYPHFPLSSVRYEIQVPHRDLGSRFATEVVPMGQLRIPSGQLAVGDPALGMAAGHNPWILIPKGSYAVALTRMICLDKGNMEIPAYLSLIVDPQGLDLRRERQKEAVSVEASYGIPEQDLREIGVLIDGGLGEMDEDDDSSQLLVSRSGVVCMVDEEAFFRRMPDPMKENGDWFNRFFGHDTENSWLKKLDEDEHLEAGIANLTLPAGPDDWIDGGPSTIALAQMLSPGDALILSEHHRHTGKLVAIHVELGLMAALAGH